MAGVLKQPAQRNMLRGTVRIVLNRGGGGVSAGKSCAANASTGQPFEGFFASLAWLKQASAAKGYSADGGLFTMSKSGDYYIPGSSEQSGRNFQIPTEKLMPISPIRQG